MLRRRDGHTWRDDVHEGEEPIAARRHRELRLLVLAGAVSVVLALGPEVYGVTTPFGLMHDHLPGFGGIRVAARLAVVAWLTLAVLAGLRVRRAHSSTCEALSGLRSRCLPAR